MTDWIVSSNPAYFNVDAAFAEREAVDWSETTNAHLKADDRVLIYQVAPVSAITHCCEVSRTGITKAETLDDKAYYTNATALTDSQVGTWMRLRGFRKFTENERTLLTLDELRSSGLNGAPQGRRRAPAEVTALVDRILDKGTARTDALALIAQERALIADLNIERPGWQFHPGRRGGTRSHSSFIYALTMPDAATALAMLRAYMNAVGLHETDRWSISAMPNWARVPDVQRFATVSGAGIELFYVWFEVATGTVSEWGMRIPAELTASVPNHDALWQSSADNGDTGVHGETLADLLDALDDAGFLGALRSTAEQRQGARRADWHNPYLGALLGVSETPLDADPEPTADEDIEFERRYIERVTKQRLHQAPLREAALRKYGARCMYCGLDVLQVLEAAHVIPDSEDGAASTSNVRILCANHHAALDAKLIRLDGENLVRVPGAPEVLPHRPITIAVPVKPDEDQPSEDEDDDSEDEERFQWIVTDPEELTPSRLGDTVLYDPADDSDGYAEGSLLGIHFISEDPSYPLDATYRLDIRPADADESVTITVSGDGYVSRYIDTEDPEAW